MPEKPIKRKPRRRNGPSIGAFRKSKAFAEGCLMPAGLVHLKPGEAYDPAKSEVLAWIGDNVTMRNYLFNRLYESGAIAFNEATRTWNGVDNDPSSLRKLLARLNDSDRQDAN